jgi:hypothetical protein
MQWEVKIFKNSFKSRRIVAKEGILQKVTGNSKINKAWLKRTIIKIRFISLNQNLINQNISHRSIY